MISPSLTIGFSLTLPTPRIPVSGGFSIGVNPSISNMLTLEIVKVPPVTSSTPSVPSRAFLASSLDSRAICRRPFLSASRRTGTIRPSGRDTAMPIFTDSCSRISSSASAEFIIGNCFNARDVARMIMSLKETLTALSFLFSSITRSLNRTISVTSTSVNTVS